MCLQDTVRIPLRAKDGSIRAYALVDAVDAAWVNQWAWRLTDKNYVARGERIAGKFLWIKLHRELLGLPRIYDGRQGDHIDHDRLNNQRSNLRSVTHLGNGQNRSGNRVSTSRHRGVSWCNRNQKWLAQISVKRRTIHLGYYASEEAAAEAARAGRTRLMPYAVD